MHIEQCSRISISIHPMKRMVPVIRHPNADIEPFPLCYHFMIPHCKINVKIKTRDHIIAVVNKPCAHLFFPFLYCNSFRLPD